MLLTCVRITDYKVIKTVEIKPDSDLHLLLLSGNNMQGKTSVLDAIDTLTAGAKAIADDPVRHGAAQAIIEGFYDNGLHIKRTINPDGSTKLLVEDNTGRLDTPQKKLEALLGKRTVDPLEFLRLDADIQHARLLAIIDTEKKIPAMDAQYEIIYNVRTEVGRKLKDAEGELHRLGNITKVDEALDTAALAAERAQLGEQQRAGDKLELAMRTADAAHAANMAALKKADEYIAKLEAELVEARSARVGWVTALNATATTAITAKSECMAAAEAWTKALPRRDQIDADLARANAHNRSVVEAEQLNSRRAAAAKVVDERRKAQAEGTAELEKIEARKLAFLAKAKLPVPGLGLHPGKDKGKPYITLNGVPLEQASGAEKLRVALGIAIASQSEIQDILIRDASLLDDESLRIVSEIVANTGYRAWLERVGTRDPGALIIQGGELVE